MLWIEGSVYLSAEGSIYLSAIATGDRAYPFRHLKDDIASLENRLGLIFELFPLEPLGKFLLVTTQDFVVSFVHLECAPFGCDTIYDNTYHNLN